MKYYYWLIPLLLIASSMGAAHAQVDDDTRLWVGFTGKFELLEQVRFDVTQELRIDDSFTGFEKTFTNLGLRWKLHEHVRLSGHYRFIAADTPMGRDLQHRLAADVEGRYDIDRLGLKYRLRLQTTSTNEGRRTFVRNKIGADYRVAKRLAPFLAFELHYSTTASEFRQVRFFAGAEYKLTRRLDLAGYYLYRHEFNVAIPERNHIIGLDVSYTFREVRGD